MRAIDTIDAAARYSARHLRQEIDFRLGTLLSTPDRVSIKLTERCNAKCTMCSFWKDSTPPSDELALESSIDLVEQVGDWARPCSFVITGGEPFVSAHTIPVLTRAVERKLDTSVHSNGIYFSSQERVARVLETGIRRIIFSVDSHIPELHDRRRGKPGLHDTVKRAIAMFKNLAPEAHITLSHIILAESAPHLCEFLDWARDAGVDSVSLQPLEAEFGRERADDWHFANPDFRVDRIALAEQIRRIQESAADRRFINNDTEDLEQFIRYFDDPDSVSIAEGQCHKGLTDIFVNQFGDVHFCWHYERVGNVGKDLLRKIWQDEVARAQRQEIKRCSKPCTGACYRHYSFTDKAGRFLRDRL